MAGDLIARAVIDGDDRWKLFLPYALVWGGGTLGRATIQVAYWSRRRREVWAEELAQRRDIRRRFPDDANGADGPLIGEPVASANGRADKNVASGGQRARTKTGGDVQPVTEGTGNQPSSTEGAA